MKSQFHRQVTSQISRARRHFLSARNPVWYHDFSKLGLSTRQIDGTYISAQELKTPQLEEMARRAFLNFTPEALEDLHGIELFCADAYFSQLLLASGVGRMTAVDAADGSPEQRHGVLEQAAFVARRLGNENRLRLVKGNVLELRGEYDFAVNFGGLYHLEDPLSFLRSLRSTVAGPMFLQTIVSLRDIDPEYFESPAPGWSWGSRFSEMRLAAMLQDAGWEIKYWSFTLAAYNERLEDRGCVFALCVPAPS